MSLFERGRVLAWLSPGRVAALRVGGRGPGPREWHAAVEASEEAGWRAPLGLLQQHLAAQPARGRVLDIGLSHHWVRFLTVPWSDQLALSRARERHLAAHAEAVFGEEAQGWTWALEPGPFGEPAVAAAVDRELLQALSELAQASGVRLGVSVPWIGAALRQAARAVGKGRLWFAAVEPGCTALALVERQRLLQVFVHPAPAPESERHILGLVRRAELRQDTAAELPVWAGGWPLALDGADGPGAGRLRHFPLPGMGAGDGLPGEQALALARMLA